MGTGFFARSRSSSSATAASSSPTSAAKLRRLLATSSTHCTPACRRLGPDDPRRTGGGPHQLPVAVRAAARAGVSRPAHRDRRRAARRGRRPVALARASATRSPTWRASGPCSRSSASRPRSPPGRSSTTCRRCAIVGGAVLIVLGLNLAGLLRIPRLERTWRPLDAGASRQRSRRRPARSPSPLGTGRRPRLGDRLGGRIVERPRRLARVVRARRDLRGRLDAVHRHHPRRDPDARRDDRHGRSRARCSSSPTRSASVCRSSRSPLVYDRAPALLAPLVRHGRAVSLVGGLLVALIGVAMVFDWLSLLPRYFTFNTASERRDRATRVHPSSRERARPRSARSAAGSSARRPSLVVGRRGHRARGDHDAARQRPPARTRSTRARRRSSSARRRRRASSPATGARVRGRRSPTARRTS